MDIVERQVFRTKAHFVERTLQNWFVDALLQGWWLMAVLQR